MTECLLSLSGFAVQDESPRCLPCDSILATVDAHASLGKNILMTNIQKWDER